MNQSLHRLVVGYYQYLMAVFLLLVPAAGMADFSGNWSGERPWIGPEYWANPLTDWHVEGNEVIGMAAGGRTLHHLTHQVVRETGAMEISVQVRFSGRERASEALLGGFRIGNQGLLDDYRHVLIYATRWIDAGVRSDGHIVLADKVSEKRLDSNEWISLRLRAKLLNGSAELVLLAKQKDTRNSVELRADVPASSLLGNLALLAGGTGKVDRDKASYWHFKEWNLRGTVLEHRPEQAFGPILWTQYTLSRNTVKLLAMMAPVDDPEQQLYLELKQGGKWVRAGSSNVDALSRTAIFRLDNWDDSRQVPYRVLYTWSGQQYSWEGVVQPDPKDKQTVTMAVFSCDNGYIFPNKRIVGNVTIQHPDILFFAGDQIYESFGGFGINREPVELAMLDYLRKYWQFGWSWRDLLKDRPSIIIPDDHDVFQGNLWGHGGRRIPELSDRPSGNDWPKGGYAMDPRWINAVERTQTGSLPDPVDPRPAGQGIGVYFTDLLYGGLHMAILEDRKFKSGPKDPFKEEPQLLGPRQEAFLERWVQQDVGDFKLALSQTIFCDVATHTGGALKKNAGGGGNDSNGWPKEKRDKALSILKGHNVIMVHGDQHLGALVYQGVDTWEDSAIAFMVPGSANGFPRAWWPDHPGEDHQSGDPEWTGRYIDSLGNRMTVLAAANPEEGSNLLSKQEIHPEIIGHRKGSGHGIVKFHRDTGDVAFEMWRLLFDAADPREGDQFAGFPKTIRLQK